MKAVVFQKVGDRRRAMPQKPVPVSADIVDFEKRRDAGKYYVYHVEVTLSNGRSYIVFRRYSQFEALHLQLQDNHPVEAGLFEERYKVLPDLPGNMYAGQSAVRDVAMRRVPELNNYLKRLLNLDPRISHDVKVQQFLSLQKGDVDSPVHIYENRLHHLITEAVDARQLLEQTAKEAEEWIESADSVRDDMSHDGVCCLYDADPVVIATLLPPQSRMPRSVICYFQGLV
ncbi:PREDICTED: SH3 and PX domain-containing protein 2A-like, partial [Priapulus caudatus]|uniref:SH3 and PX domain-containing protein 2A-like n=1 Tax=Priapulus caudatus TaxID=37621 RepID=A0ABM1EPB8_PRICU